MAGSASGLKQDWRRPIMLMVGHVGLGATRFTQQMWKLRLALLVSKEAADERKQSGKRDLDMTQFRKASNGSCETTRAVGQYAE